MQNAFLVIRTVFFALLLCLNVLLLVFAGWNLSATGNNAPGAPILVIISSSLILLFVTLASIAEAISSQGTPEHVRVECTWTVLMGTMQLASSINVTVNGPPIICHSQWTWSTCASSSLLVPVTWIVTLIILTYCLTICITAFVHAPSIPDIWRMPVSSVPWFNVDAKVPSPTTEVFAKDSPTTKAFSRASNASMESCAVTKYITERWGRLTHIEGQPECTSKLASSKGHQSTDNARPAWVRQNDRQRGVDQPFAKPPPLPALRGVLPPPPRTIPAKEAAVPRDARYVGRSEMKWGNDYSTLNSNAKTFPKGTAHPDHPIALPHLSQRIRADGTKAGYF
ncbi:hypothetical protein EDD16DRAFT_995317 [Pisolithus croceorrhizus]|nr:hypothetical protein EDD16DRAFT_995317 [Pisolithus croceorrhizus]KAI6131799.1 hypothetical protein EV401DRAFT_315547 [Pisolithus croceorrhizus]KAI6162451.1 hypothetical protein EDD17DRAFT_547914 [Pisolithus thermaeus]